jgi:hypothetical protein
MGNENGNRSYTERRGTGISAPLNLRHQHDHHVKQTSQIHDIGTTLALTEQDSIFHATASILPQPPNRQRHKLQMDNVFVMHLTYSRHEKGLSWRYPPPIGCIGNLPTARPPEVHPIHEDSRHASVEKSPQTH